MESAGVQLARVTIAVASGKGGVGKSTIALNLALALAERGAQVGLLDADVYGPDLPLMVGLTRRLPARSVTLWDRRSTTGPGEEPVERFGIKLMSTQFLVSEDQPFVWSALMVDALLDRLVRRIDWGELDFLLVDLPPGTADVPQRMARLIPLTKALVVVTPQDASHLDAKKVLAMFDLLGITVLGGIENMSGMACPHCGEPLDVFPAVDPHRSIWASGVERLGAVPLDPAVARAGDRGRPVMVEDPDGPQAAAFRALAERVTAESLA